MRPNGEPALDGDLLATLGAMRSGELLTLVAGVHPRRYGAGRLFELPMLSTAEAVTRLLEVFPLDQEAAPIAYCDGPWFDDGLPDAGFVVSGAASDAERRRVPMTRLPVQRFSALASTSPVTVFVDRLGSSAAFLLRRA